MHAQGRPENRVTTLLHSSLTTAASGSTSILLRFNGRPRRRLPIACAAPGPCSAIFCRTPFHHPGLSERRMKTYSSLHCLIQAINAFIVALSSQFVKWKIQKIWTLFPVLPRPRSFPARTQERNTAQCRPTQGAIRPIKEEAFAIILTNPRIHAILTASLKHTSIVPDQGRWIYGERCICKL